MPTIDRDGVKIHYDVSGEGFPILFTHGFAASGLMWNPQHEELGKRYKVISWDMRGHARTDSPADPARYSEAETVADMLAILDAAGAEQAAIGGHSLGGYMTLAFHYAHPERCRALILLGTGPGYRNPKGREGWNETTERRAETFESRGLEGLGGSAEVRVSRDAHRSAQGLAHAARGMLKQFDSRVIESLPNIKVPVLVVVGENDTPFLNSSDYMANQIPGGRKLVIANAGHGANIDQPDVFNRAVIAFLDEIGVPSRAGAANLPGAG